ncbi:SGNH/GDSL hydrolase family protein [Sphingomonas sp. MA1305]|uniref:SGNH/GDSL hydrolase family protein n=1 Tax=Sphingomonas sp. MA1305 TaxID=2479204 RepID=UPI0018DF3324|nr:SGNH/GDSL hydrolase family protein [Sphingomonas sp. MA1305]
MRTIVVAPLRKPTQIIASGGLTAVLLPAPPRDASNLLTIRLARLATGVALFTPVLTAGPVTVAPTALGSSVAAFPPRVIAASTAILPPALLSTGVPFAPGVQPGGMTVQPPLRDSNAAIFPLVVTAPAAGSILPPLLPSSSTSPSPAVQPGGVGVAPTLLASAAAFYAPVVQTVGAGSILVDLLPSTVAPYPPAVTAGAVTVSPPALPAGGQQFAPSVQPGAATVAPPALATTASFYAPSVLPGVATVAPPAAASSVVLRAPAVVPGTASIVPALLASTSLTRAPSVAAGGGNSSLTPTTVTLGTSWYGAGNPPYSGYYMGAYYATHPDRTLNNMALGGSGLDYLESRVPDIIAAKPYVVVLEEGPNDFMVNNSGGQVSQDEFYANYVERYRTVIANLKEALPGVAVAVETITERHASDGEANGINAEYNARRPAFNDQIRQWKASGFIAQVIDIGGDAVLGRVGGMQIGSPESNDGLHLSEGGADAGHTLAKPIFAAAMDALYAATPLPGSSEGTYVSDYALTGSPSVTEGNSGTVNAAFTVSEEWEGDVSATLHRILTDAGIIDDDTGAIATLAASPANHAGSDIRPGESLADRDRRIYEQGRRDACEDHGIVANHAGSVGEAAVDVGARALHEAEDSWNDYEWEYLPETVQASFRDQARHVIRALAASSLKYAESGREAEA